MTFANDSFTGNNGDPPDPSRWINSGTEIQSNALEGSVNSGNVEEYVISKFLMPGDFDIEIDFNLSASPATLGWLIHLSVADDDSSGGLPDDLVRIGRQYTTDQFYNFNIRTAGSFGTADKVAKNDSSGKFRLVRSGTTFSGYYNDSGWVLLGSGTHSMANCYVILQWSTNTGLPTMTGSFDNFLVNSGTVHVLCQSTDGVSIDDNILAFNLSDGFSDLFTIDDLVEAFGPVPVEVADDLTIDDSVHGGFEIQGSVLDGFSMDDDLTVGFEYQGPVSDDLTIADLVDALNWSQFLRENQDIAVIRYYFTLTGSADETTDIEIPISSFQARKRTGYATSLTVVIPDYVAWAAAVTARPNGSMIIDMAYLVNGLEEFREQILAVELDDIRPDKGSRSRSITLLGSRTQSFGTQLVAVENSSYRYLSDGKIGHRFSRPDPWLNPGDTCQVGDDEFVVDWVNYVVSARYRSMEIRSV